jgi:hypothetical protein
MKTIFLNHLKTEMKKTANTENHFHYIDKIVDPFCKELKLKLDKKVIKESLAKVSNQIFTYKFKWKKAKVPFNRGAFLYVIGPILKISEDKPKHITLDVWVIDFYEANTELQVIFDKLEQQLAL